MAIKGRFFKGITITSVSLIIFFTIIVIALQIALTPKNLNRIVTSFGDEYLNAQIKADTIKLQVFKHFPYLTISIRNGQIITGSLDSLKEQQPELVPQQADTLLKFKHFNISLSVPQLLSSNINIHRIGISSPKLYIYTAPDGSTNYDILKTISTENAADTTACELSRDESQMKISVNRVSIRNGVEITYNSQPDSLMAILSLNSANLRGTFSTDMHEMQFHKADISRLSINTSKQVTVNDTLHSSLAEFALDSLSIINQGAGRFTIGASARTNLEMDQTVIAGNIPIELSGAIAFDTTQAVSGTLEDITLSIARIPILFNGGFTYSNDSILARNISGSVNGMNISDLFQYIPDKYFKAKESVKSNATLNVRIDVNGSYNFATGELPSLYASLSIPESYVEFEGMKSRINHLETDIKAYFSSTCKDSAAIEINKFILNGRGIHLGTNGKIEKLHTNNPFVDVEFSASANLDTLCNLFPASKGSEFTGIISADMSISSKLSDLTPYRLGNAGLKGSIKTDKSRIIMPEEGIYAILSGINIVAGSSVNTTDASIKRGMKMLATNSTADSIYIKVKDELMVAARSLRFAGHHSAEILAMDTTQKRVLPFNGIIEAKRLDVRGTDSVALSMTNTKVNFGILPYQEDYTIPSLSLKAQASRIFARGLENRYSVRDGEFSINAVLDNKENKARKEKMQKMLDSLQTIYPDIRRDSLLKHSFAMRAKRFGQRSKNDFAQEDIDLSVDRSIRDILLQWKINGALAAKSGRVTTPYFPQRNRLENLNFEFNTNEIKFNNTTIKSGNSAFTLSGKVDGLKGAMLGRGNIGVKAKIEADTINFNQLFMATNAGMAYMDASQSFKDSLAKESDEDALEELIATDADSVASQLFVLPGNLNANISLNVKHGIYSKIALNKIAGDLTIRNRCLKISNFEALTNAGAMEMSAFYATRSKKDISTGFDLELKDILVEKFIEATPAVDSLLPMLRSLQGRINCQFAATSQLDTAMNFIVPTLRGVARITGDSLVLMDGETFALIAKKLKFKNKQRNLIDRVAVEMIIDQSKIDIFPFIMQMDRYQFALSGTQNLDLSFDYHISVLQSPIPFRLGVSVYGNTDNFKFKIGKAKYKNASLPVYTTLIDSTRLNLRSQIADIYRIGIDAALKENMALRRIKEEKAKNDLAIPQEMEALTKEEEQQLEEIEPNITNQ